jgi:hypothetical protein
MIDPHSVDCHLAGHIDTEHAQNLRAQAGTAAARPEDDDDWVRSSLLRSVELRRTGSSSMQLFDARLFGLLSSGFLA